MALRIFAGLLVSSLVVAFPAWSQDNPVIQVRKEKSGKQVITNVIKTDDPVAPGSDKKPTIKDAPAVALQVSEWKYGRDFIDGTGRYWRLVHGSTVGGEFIEVRGWIVTTADERPFLFTLGGRLYQYTPPQR